MSENELNITMEQVLAGSVNSDTLVDKVIIGLNWTMVRAGDLCGVARSPDRGTEGARTIRPSEGFSGKTLGELAGYLCSPDSLMRSLGLAAVNAWWNRKELFPEAEKFVTEMGGLSAIEAPGENVVIVGGFRGAQKRLPLSRIIEREPKPGDTSVEDAPQAYAEAKQLAITAQTLMNGSLPSILEQSAMVSSRILVGPSTPLCPLLFNFGLTELSGAVIIDADAAETFILESGTMIMLDNIAVSRHLIL
ncbi:DUF364 domain-containing protein [Vibrio sp. DW001]|uniref:Rossmann-like domain-containing protein n=1 Tax=Vibrio sp. DW001 TaxID=2912315 RepID=UPI0023AF3437|nr:DUF364 domain-containing protein [Vibrio sp. DW001]WED25771.1 DUF364 domain-containing protein [Vibrio sp. DW001]